MKAVTATKSAPMEPDLVPDEDLFVVADGHVGNAGQGHVLDNGIPVGTVLVEPQRKYTRAGSWGFRQWIQRGFIVERRHYCGTVSGFVHDDARLFRLRPDERWNGGLVSTLASSWRSNTRGVASYRAEIDSLRAQLIAIAQRVPDLHEDEYTKMAQLARRLQTLPHYITDAERQAAASEASIATAPRTFFDSWAAFALDKPVAELTRDERCEGISWSDGDAVLRLVGGEEIIVKGGDSV